VRGTKRLEKTREDVKTGEGRRDAEATIGECSEGMSEKPGHLRVDAALRDRPRRHEYHGGRGSRAAAESQGD